MFKDPAPKQTPSSPERKQRFIASEYGLYSEGAAKKLKETVEKTSISDVANLLLKRFEDAQSDKEANRLLGIESALVSNPSAETLQAALDEVEKLHETVSAISQETTELGRGLYKYNSAEQAAYQRRLNETQGLDGAKLDAMRHFLKRKLKEKDDAESHSRVEEISARIKNAENGEGKRILTETKKKASFAANEIQRRLGEPIGLDKLGLSDKTPEKWEKLASGLEDIRRMFTKDMRTPGKEKSAEYKERLRKLFDSLG